MSDFAYCDRCYCLYVWLSVYHVRALCSNGRRYRHDFFSIRLPYHSPRSCHLADIGLPLPPQIFASKWSTRPPPVHLSVGDIRWQAQYSEIVQWSQWRAYRKPPSLFWMVPSLTIWLPQPPSPKMEVGDVAFCQITLALVSKSVRFIAFCFRHNAFCR